MSKKILLVDVDSKIPNMALMKLSTYYKSKGYQVDLKKLNYSYYPKERNVALIDGTDYDKVFISIIFRLNKNVVRVIGCNDITFGGVGYSLDNKLNQEIEDLQLDYSIYPENDTSYGFITRGCIRNCYFCVVPKKEGMIHQVNNIDNIVKHKKVKFLDNNILAFKNHIEILKELKAKNIKCQFNQGLDIRLVTEENAKLLSELNYLGEYYFAFDSIKDKAIIEFKLGILRKYIKKDWKIKMFLYCHPDMDIKEEVVFRVNWCKENKILPYFMRDESCWDSKHREFYIDLASYCNQVSLFKKMEFKDYIVRRTKNKERQQNSIKLYYSQMK